MTVPCATTRSTQPTFETDWEAVAFLVGWVGIFALICWWIVWSERRDRERMCAPHRRARTKSLVRDPNRRVSPSVGSGWVGGECPPAVGAPPTPQTPVGVVERQAATPTGFHRSRS